MILTDEQLLQIMKEPRNGKAIVAGSYLQNKHKVHITGEGYEKEVKQVEGYEADSEYNIRKQIAQPSTIQITSIILDNLNRWTSAQGTVKKVDFKDKNKNDEFQEILSQVWHGDSLEKFITTFYRDAIYTEFNGFILVTKPKVIDANFIEKEGVIVPRKSEALDPYLIFVSNSDVHDFLLTGDKVEYIVINLGDDYYRFIDDAQDIVFKWRKDKQKIVESEGIANELGFVPAIKVSQLNKQLLSDQVKTSPIDHIIPALDRYFSADADLRMQFIRHAYPKLAIVTKQCETCNGSGTTFLKLDDGTYDMDTKVDCKSCGGTGKVVPISRGGVIGLPEYISSQDSPYPGAPASYITPDNDSLRLCIEDLESQYKSIVYSGTGDKNLIAENIQTATENVTNSRSLEDRIRDITLMVEKVEKFLIECVIKLHNDFKSLSDYYISIRYGKRISTKSETELLNEAKAAKDSGMPTSYVSALHKDLIYAKYKNNHEELQRQLLLAEVEPLSAYSIDEIDKVKDYLDKRDLEVKLNFDAIIAELEQEIPLYYFMPEADYRTKVATINRKIDEILQRRVGENNPSGRQGLGTVDEN